jgi:Ca2+-binding EF-hand superfamily protein
MDDSSGSSRRALRRVRLEADCGEDLTPLQADWLKVFERLDQADGTTDGLIERAALLKWVSALDMQKTIEFEASLNISPYDLQRLVSKADENKDGYVDKCEFLRLVSNRDRELTKEQKRSVFPSFHLKCNCQSISTVQSAASKR